MKDKKDTLGWDQTKEAPVGDEPNAEQPATRIDAKPKLGSDEKPRLANNERKST